MHTRLLLSFLALAFASGIILTSLFTASSSFSSTGTYKSSEKTMYFDREILPDHALYPVLMAMDRVQLETTTEDIDRIFLEMEYAHRRLEYGETLIKQGKIDLGITTVTKAEQYLHKAVQEATTENVASSVTNRLKKAIEYHQKRLKELKTAVSDSDRVVLDQWIAQDQALLEQLQ